MLMFAALTRPRLRCTEATTDTPTPNMSPIPVASMKNGATILTAASASLPTKRPTNMPSVIVIDAANNMPIIVGISICRNSFGMFSFPKSMASLSFFSIAQID